MSIRSEITGGIAEVLWASGWEQHVEEHGCARTSGMEITAVMPPVPDEAIRYAHKWAAEVARKNKTDLETLYHEALEANDRQGVGGDVNGRRSNPGRFGADLAFMMMGTGPSWFDNNAEFDLKVPDHEFSGEVHDLEHLAGETCPRAWVNPPCEACGAWNRPGVAECAHCGAELPEENDEEETGED